MDIKKRIQELSLDQKAKLYFMGLVRKGVIDTLPKDPKAAYIRDMMDKEDPKMDPAIRSDFDEPMFENLRELSTELGYLQEEKNCGCGKNPCETYGNINEKKSYQNLPYTYEVLLDDLDFETLKSSFPEYYQNEKFIRPQTGEPYYSDNISFPNPDDSMSQIGDPESLEDWKDKTRRRFGDVIIKFNNKAKNWFDKVFVDDFEFNYAKEKFIRGKQDFIDKERKLGRSID